MRQFGGYRAPQLQSPKFEPCYELDKVPNFISKADSFVGSFKSLMKQSIIMEVSGVHISNNWLSRVDCI